MCLEPCFPSRWQGFAVFSAPICLLSFTSARPPKQLLPSTCFVEWHNTSAIHYVGSTNYIYLHQRVTERGRDRERERRRRRRRRKGRRRRRRKESRQKKILILHSSSPYQILENQNEQKLVPSFRIIKAKQEEKCVEHRHSDQFPLMCALIRDVSGPRKQHGWFCLLASGRASKRRQNHEMKLK